MGWNTLVRATCRRSVTVLRGCCRWRAAVRFFLRSSQILPKMSASLGSITALLQGDSAPVEWGRFRVFSESYGELRFLLQRYKISLKYTREPPVFLKFSPDFSKSPYNGKWKAESGKLLPEIFTFWQSKPWCNCLWKRKIALLWMRKTKVFRFPFSVFRYKDFGR